MSEREFENYLAILNSLLRYNGKQREEIAAELRAHLEDRVDDLLARGVSQEEAVRRALEEFGGAAGLAAEFISLAQRRKRRWIMSLTTYSVAATALLAAGIAIFWPGRNAGPGIATVSAQISTPTAASVPDARAKDGDLKVAQALNQRMDIDYSEVPLKDVVTHLTAETGVTFHLKAKKLEEASISPDTPINCRFRDIRLSTLLELMLDELELTYVEKDGLVLITTPEDAESRLDIRVYDCRDLIAMPTPEVDKKSTIGTAGTALPGGDALPAELRPIAGKADQARSGTGGTFRSRSAQREAERPLTAYERRTEGLMDIVMAIVAPTTWDEVGGPGSIEAYNGLIIISQTAETHRMVAQVFDMLRRAAGLDVAKAGKVVRE